MTEYNPDLLEFWETHPALQPLVAAGRSILPASTPTGRRTWSCGTRGRDRHLPASATR